MPQPGKHYGFLVCFVYVFVEKGSRLIQVSLRRPVKTPKSCVLTNQNRGPKAQMYN